MSSEKFTPGEWRRADLTSRNGKTMRGKSFCRVVCGNHNVAYSYTCKTKAEQKANAALIAAAPEMYKFIGWLGSVEGQCAILNKDPEIVRKAHAILKKARGEE